MRDCQIFFGDIHNHNGLGYGRGSLERSIAIAREHLDFFAFTGHAAWHDLAPLAGERHHHWLAGFARHNSAWSKIQSLVSASHQPGSFAAFLGYEWHSSRYGDHCLVFPADHRPLYLPETLADLRHFALSEEALMIPHHLAYAAGARGVNWEEFVAGPATPVVEIYSEHGSAEHDRGPYPYSRHSMGGRITAHTARAALAQGHRFGFAASSDNHRGFPGAYGEGVLAVLARELTRPALMEAIRARRTYALTGDRIRLRLLADGHPMGSVLKDTGRELSIDYTIEGRDELDRVELIANGHVVKRLFPEPAVAAGAALREPVQLRLEWGWGPWKDLDLARICDWEFTVRVHGGRLLRWFPCLQSGPFSEERRHRIRRTGPLKLEVQSYTARQGAFRQRPTQSLVLELEGGDATEVEVAFRQPAARTSRLRLDRLLQGGASGAAGPFPAERYLFHRLVPRAASRLSGALTLPHDLLTEPAQTGAASGAYLYLRVVQQNEQLAWSSPWFLPL